MDLGTIVNLLTTASLAAGLIFAGIQWRASRRENRRLSQIQVLRSFESPEFVRAMRLVLDLPDGLSRSDLETRLGRDGTDLVWYWLGVMESLGILVHDRFVEILDVEQTYSAPVLVTFRKLHPYIEDVRASVSRDTMHEWFQWLAERLEQLERDKGRLPAHVREAGWRP
jgi:hypothetical protein